MMTLWSGSDIEIQATAERWGSDDVDSRFLHT